MAIICKIDIDFDIVIQWKLNDILWDLFMR